MHFHPPDSVLLKVYELAKTYSAQSLSFLMVLKKRDAKATKRVPPTIETPTTTTTSSATPPLFHFINPAIDLPVLISGLSLLECYLNESSDDKLASSTTDLFPFLFRLSFNFPVLHDIVLDLGLCVAKIDERFAQDMLSSDLDVLWTLLSAEQASNSQDMQKYSSVFGKTASLLSILLHYNPKLITTPTTNSGATAAGAMIVMEHLISYLRCVKSKSEEKARADNSSNVGHTVHLLLFLSHLSPTHLQFLEQEEDLLISSANLIFQEVSEWQEIEDESLVTWLLQETTRVIKKSEKMTKGFRSLMSLPRYKKSSCNNHDLQVLLEALIE